MSLFRTARRYFASGINHNFYFSWQCQQFCSARTPDPDTSSSNVTDSIQKQISELDLALVEQLERIALVELDNEAGLSLLQTYVQLGSKLQEVDTTDVKPLVTVLEDRELWMRPDKVTEGDCVKEILHNASVTEEQYFVAPPGNIPLKKKSKDHLISLLATDHSNTDS